MPAFERQPLSLKGGQLGTCLTLCDGRDQQRRDLTVTEPPNITELSERIRRRIKPGTTPLLDSSALRQPAADAVSPGEQPDR